ncbi:Proteasomal ubiquitin receptor ADRM1 [Sciurus carolinensis]|uniref:Proteasomal ubiquitin receptor ADRM1 n=1 Tax=Sciurus carolinensis TaxID=30640 RepID=A0AA41MG36_SCICA|nr:Proteasomal ubiquitin receptor ADRM1 [Sciurus carolinensis]
MMTSGALFPSLVPGFRGSSEYLVEFQAGKMSLKGTTVTPDKQKGLVYIRQTDNSLIHFCRKDRTSGTVEDDFIIFPDDCDFKHVPQRPSGKVSVLKFKAGSKQLFFWMQEPKTHQVEEHCWEVNEYLNNHPHMPGALGASGSGGHEPSALGGEAGLQSLLGNMRHSQLMQLMDQRALGDWVAPKEGDAKDKKDDEEAMSLDCDGHGRGAACSRGGAPTSSFLQTS